MFRLLAILWVSVFLFSCGGDKKKTYFKKSEIDLNEPSPQVEGEEKKPELFIKPKNVWATANPDHKLVTVYKEKLSKNRKYRYIDGDYQYHSYPNYYIENENAWHGHYLPGLSAVWGNNMYNVMHYDVAQDKKQFLFDRSVLVNTLYFPSELQDTLNSRPITRDYYLVSVYDEDTNNDTLINRRDLRTLYRFDIDGTHKKRLIPSSYNVIKSDYDNQADALYIFTKLDQNKNGKKDHSDPDHVFMLKLSKADTAVMLY